MPRHEKVAQAIRRQVSNIVHDELKDPRLGFVTITQVEVSADLRHAKILYSVLGKDEDYKRTKEAFESAGGFIRKRLGEEIEFRFVPEIIFREDRGTEYSVRIQEVLNEIKELNEQATQEKQSSSKRRKVSKRKK